MKKKYTKPGFEHISISLNESIAAGCDYKLKGNTNVITCQSEIFRNFGRNQLTALAEAEQTLALSGAAVTAFGPDGWGHNDTIFGSCFSS